MCSMETIFLVSLHLISNNIFISIANDLNGCVVAKYKNSFRDNYTRCYFLFVYFKVFVQQQKVRRTFELIARLIRVNSTTTELRIFLKRLSRVFRHLGEAHEGCNKPPLNLCYIKSCNCKMNFNVKRRMIYITRGAISSRHVVEIALLFINN